MNYVKLFGLLVVARKMKKHNYYLLTLVLISLLFASCGPRYVEIQDPYNKVETSCFSFVLPAEGNWHKLWKLAGTACKDRMSFVSGNETDIYWIFIISYTSFWKDKFDSEYLLQKAEKFILSERDNLRNIKEYGIESFDYELNEVRGIKDITVKLKYNFSSTKPLSYSTGGLGGANPTTLYSEIKLDESEKYYYEIVEYRVIEGPYKVWPAREALFYKVIFMHLSINENSDPEFESTALNFLKNLAFTKDWEKETNNTQ